MYKKIFSVKLVLILTLSSLGVLTMTDSSFAKLKDFKSDVERNEKSKKKNKSGRGSSDSDSESSCAGECAKFAIQAAFGLWAAHHMLVFYEKYPYSSTEKNFVNYYFPYSDIFKENKKENDHLHVAPEEKIIDTTSETHTIEDLKSFSKKFYHYTIAAGGQWADNEGSGLNIEFRGKFMQHFGPEFYARSLWDSKDDIQFYSGGLNLSLFQNSYFSMDFYITGTFMRGVIKRDGVGFGAVITSYPFKPVTLFFRVGGLDFGKTDFLEFEGRIGYMIGRVEIFAGYQMIHHPDILDIGGPIGGVRVFL